MLRKPKKGLDAYLLLTIIHLFTSMNDKKHLFSESSEAMTGMQGTIFEVEVSRMSDETYEEGYCL